jgi:hypothetical protein
MASAWQTCRALRIWVGGGGRRHPFNRYSGIASSGPDEARAEAAVVASGDAIGHD